MKLVTFERDNGLRPGVLTAREGREVVIDLQQADASLPGSVRGILEGGPATLSQAAEAADSASDTLDAATVRLAAPIPNPGKILCIGLNYADHAAESGQPLPDYPIVFSKYSNTVIGSGDAIILPKVTAMVDYEAELGFVIGQTGPPSSAKPTPSIMSPAICRSTMSAPAITRNASANGRWAKASTPSRRWAPPL